MKLQQALSVMSACILLSACVTANDPELAELSLLVAESRIDKAAVVGNEWRDSRSVLQRAQEAYQKGDFPTAVALARQARFEGETALKQAESQQASEPTIPK